MINELQTLKAEFEQMSTMTLLTVAQEQYGLDLMEIFDMEREDIIDKMISIEEHNYFH